MAGELERAGWPGGKDGGTGAQGGLAGRTGELKRAGWPGGKDGGTGACRVAGREGRGNWGGQGGRAGRTGELKRAGGRAGMTGDVWVGVRGCRGMTVKCGKGQM